MRIIHKTVTNIMFATTVLTCLPGYKFRWKFMY